MNDGSKYGIDLTSPEHQKMSETLATHDVLQETAYVWLNGTTMWFSVTDMKDFTYADFAEHIGNDANEFFYDTKYDSRNYLWYASDREYARFMALFKQNAEGNWVIYATGATQIKNPNW